MPIVKSARVFLWITPTPRSCCSWESEGHPIGLAQFACARVFGRRRSIAGRSRKARSARKVGRANTNSLGPDVPHVFLSRSRRTAQLTAERKSSTVIVYPPALGLEGRRCAADGAAWCAGRALRPRGGHKHVLIAFMPSCGA